MRALIAHAAMFGLLTLRHIGFAPAVESTANRPLTDADMTQFWAEPADLPQRNLFDGAWGADFAPPPDATYQFVEQHNGFSPGFDLKGPDGIEWSAKLGDEAQTEVVASRVVSAVGYHQPPVYYVRSWKLEGGPSPGLQPAARLRPKVKGLDVVAHWSWQQDPFVDTRPYRGLIVLMMILNNSDLGTLNNYVYDLDDRREGARHWYVVRDLGASLGSTGYYRPRRNYIEGFEEQPLIKFVKADHVQLEYHGLEQELLKRITVDDVRWMCELLSRLSRDQWNDAFRAGGYDEQTAARYIAKIQEKISDGLALDHSTR